MGTCVRTPARSHREPLRPIPSRSVRTGDNFRGSSPTGVSTCGCGVKRRSSPWWCRAEFCCSAVALLTHSGWLTLALPALSFLYYCALIGGMLLAWRFHSSRTFFALVVLFLAQQAIALFGSGTARPERPGGLRCGQ